MRSLLAILAAASTCLVASAADAHQAVPAARKRAALHFRSVPLHAALVTLFGGRGLLLVLEPEVPNTPVTLNRENLDFASALRALADHAGLTYRQEGATVYVIGLRLLLHPGPWAPLDRRGAPATQERRFTFDFRRVPFRQALDEFFRGAGQRYAVVPDAPNGLITLRLWDVPFPEALRALLGAAGAVYIRDADLYIIEKRQPPAPVPAREKIT